MLEDEMQMAPLWRFLAGALMVSAIVWAVIEKLLLLTSGQRQMAGMGQGRLNGIGGGFLAGLPSFRGVFGGGGAGERPAGQRDDAGSGARWCRRPSPVFSPRQKKAAGRYHLAVAGHKFTSRSESRNISLYRAAELTLEQHDSWFTFDRTAGQGRHRTGAQA